MKPISRSSGRSAVAAAAYRSGTRLTNERDGLTHDYTRKGGIEHSEIVLPEGANADWALDREALWNAAELAEKRKDARVAREIEVALPHELSREERLELVRAFSQGLADRYGVAVDFSLHTPDGDMDIRNHHAHIMFTTRQVGEDELGDKTDLERENKWLKARELPTTDEQVKALRVEWEETTNRALARAGHDLRIDHHSHQDRGLEIEPTQHVGVHATQMDKRGKDVERQRLEEEARVRNAELIRQNPDQVLTLITGEKSVFDRRDVARTLHRYINDDVSEYQALFTKVLASDQLVKLQDGRDGDGPRYSTREMVDLETGMARDVSAMSGRSRHQVATAHVERAIDTQDGAIRRSVAAGLPDGLAADQRARRLDGVGISNEQRDAVRHLTSGEQVSVVVGFAGAGKSTMLAAAREAWEAEGYRVHGAALAGKAVAGLEESAGITGRTLASWEMRWQMGTAQLGPRDVLVIDEAGMIGSRQMARFVSEAERTGAKLVLVGDHEQLQAIGAGAPFRAIAEEVGYASVEDIRRQRSDWQRQASRAFATARTGEGLSAYQEHGHIHLKADQEAARAGLVRDYVEDMQSRPEGSRAAMAHRRVDVHALNVDIRNALKESGLLPLGSNSAAALAPDERAGGEADAAAGEFRTDNGVREFVPGDRIVFLKNDNKLDVKNGTFGTVEQVHDGRLMARLDGNGRRVEIDRASDYTAFDHGYATTIHKTQGATVDRAYVLASDTMDRHMTYVAMTRHRDQGSLYAGKDQFADMDSLKARLGRSGAKETVLDYVDRDGRRRETGQQIDGKQVVGTEGFARRRGIDSDIVWSVEAQAASPVRDRDRFGRGETVRDRPAPLHDDSGDNHPGKDNLAYHQGSDNARRWPSQGFENDGVRREVRGKIEVESDLAPVHGALGGQGGRGIGNTSRERDPVAGSRKRQDRETDLAQEAPKKRGMFAGLKLNSAPLRDEPTPEHDGTEDRLARRQPTDLERSVDRFARSYAAISKMDAQGLPVLEGQRREAQAAIEDMDRARPGTSKVMKSALKHDPEMRHEMERPAGRERSKRMVKRLDHERKLQNDPNVRADRFIGEWNTLKRGGPLPGDRQPSSGRSKLAPGLSHLLSELTRDPQMESVLRNRTRELGLETIRQGQSLVQEMERQMQRNRERDRGLER
jgi:Ti-type conjugative transfer relaxase TraA